MDPRPYHYEYRRPRLNNPTYQSVNLYQSLYHRGILNRYENNNKINTFIPKNQFQRRIYSQSIQNKSAQFEKQPSPRIQPNQPLNHKLSNSVMFQSNINPEQNRPYSNRSNNSNHSNKIEDFNTRERHSVLASYGKNSMLEQKGTMNSIEKQKKMSLINSNIQKLNSQPYDHLNRFSVYKKQQKPFNIIGNYPRSTSTDLRTYPKLTLQNKLIEQGRFDPC